MSPAFKYFWGRLCLLVAAFALLWPTPLNILIKLMLALVVSAGAGYFLLARWRNEMGEQLSNVAQRRTAEKERLRAALAGDEDAAAAGDRVVAAESKAAKKAGKTDTSETGTSGDVTTAERESAEKA